MGGASENKEVAGKYYLAVFNRGLLKAPMSTDVNKEFIASLGPVMAIAESQKGFVWRFRSGTDGPKDESYKEVDSQFPGLALLNLSLWESVDHLRHFLYKSGHAPYLRRKKEWFYEDNGELPPVAPASAPHHVLWWHPAGAEPPDFHMAMLKCSQLLEHGPSPEAFTVRNPFSPPGLDGLSVAKNDAFGNDDAYWRQPLSRSDKWLLRVLLSTVMLGMIAARVANRKP
mmetsp:Transcript_81359/g.143589  ORF Transcript_81359/g.143589 Transcript_81359/m.143589 type:complete len:228 (+) Transcript_81359:81-764(+)|eukprot:CAMPEP_0197691934 /NCGR_PEP_ID=MMETSP1338-20131121/110419_1 /TAXON_ID=43686 ORGANISM="Pelagodinium beii, Strain RCC1491" /NCGR_SAMPLE_ID=MMETSP1338 /ASSEMBLY_ACC=CAM_ASM_000754 /LENGTH=227 /DNA_ID=CAMNT_0043274543 /DNA_START=33 /DNA_END=716 /DNA_ORIENTATION=+